MPHILCEDGTFIDETEVTELVVDRLGKAMARLADGDVAFVVLNPAGATTRAAWLDGAPPAALLCPKAKAVKGR